ncbi:MAG: hypothetical protein KC414_13950, partial [Romboutsia sp.]|nr:hypothetical protein [Romboutsia sp.]
MKIKELDNQEIVVGGTKEMSFSIDDSNPIIFDILRNKMYSNKIGAICREVSSNSRDANREAGQADKPIEIEITSTNSMFDIGDAYIIFRDFGLGISPDRMENIFVKYASSTKRTSNSQTGGFGLGAKTPFAYTDSFIVKTVCDINGDNWEYIYNAIIDKSGKGKMILLDEKLTDKVTGTEIIVPINNNDDRYRFERECYRATMFWKIINYLGFYLSKPSVNVVYESDVFKVIQPLDNFDRYSEHYIGLIDGIPYPIYPSVKKGGLGDNFHIMFDLELDNITINANRESIQNDQETLDYLNEKVEKVEEFLGEVLDDYCVKHENYLEALRKYSVINNRKDYRETYTDLEEMIFSIRESYSDKIMSGYDFELTYKGEKVNSKFGLKYHKIQKTSNTELTTDRDGKITHCKFEYKDLDGVKSHLLNKPLVYFDVKRNSYPKNLQILEDNDVDCFLLIKPLNRAKDEEVQKDLDILKKYELDYQLYSEIEVKKKLNYKREKSDEVVISARTFPDINKSLGYTYNKVTTKLSHWSTNYYKNEVVFIPVNSLKDAEYLEHGVEVEMYKILKLFSKITQFIIVNERTFERHLKPNGYKTIYQEFKKLKKEDLSCIRD